MVRVLAIHYAQVDGTMQVAVYDCGARCGYVHQIRGGRGEDSVLDFIEDFYKSASRVVVGVSKWHSAVGAVRARIHVVTIPQMFNPAYYLLLHYKCMQEWRALGRDLSVEWLDDWRCVVRAADGGEHKVNARNVTCSCAGVARRVADGARSPCAHIVAAFTSLTQAQLQKRLAAIPLSLDVGDIASAPPPKAVLDININSDVGRLSLCAQIYDGEIIVRFTSGEVDKVARYSDINQLVSLLAEFLKSVC